MPPTPVACVAPVAQPPRAAALTPAAMPPLMKFRRLTDVLSCGLRSPGFVSRFLAMFPLPLSWRVLVSPRPDCNPDSEPTWERGIGNGKWEMGSALYLVRE